MVCILIIICHKEVCSCRHFCNKHILIVITGGAMNDKSARNNIFVVSEKSIKLISEEDKLDIERHGCKLFEESWSRKSCSDGKFGLLEEAFPNYRLAEPFHDINAVDFKQGLIHVRRNAGRY